MPPPAAFAATGRAFHGFVQLVQIAFVGGQFFGAGGLHPWARAVGQAHARAAALAAERLDVHQQAFLASGHGQVHLAQQLAVNQRAVKHGWSGRLQSGRTASRLLRLPGNWSLAMAGVSITSPTCSRALGRPRRVKLHIQKTHVKRGVVDDQRSAAINSLISAATPAKVGLPSS